MVAVFAHSPTVGIKV